MNHFQGHMSPKLYQEAEWNFCLVLNKAYTQLYAHLHFIIVSQSTSNVKWHALKSKPAFWWLSFYFDVILVVAWLFTKSVSIKYTVL